MNIVDLDLAEPAKGVAIALSAEFPWVEFMSGRRSLEGQARAMAQNVALDPRWIVKTYRPSLPARQCQLWVTQHPGSSPERIEAGLMFVLKALTPAQLSQLSKHFVGLAFDVRPDLTPRGDDVKSWLRAAALQHRGRFLDHEGDLARWHIEF